MEKIIIIDDEISICSLLTFALEKNYDVQATTDLEMGLEIIKKESIDLVLMDLNINNKNGIIILEEIKKINKNISVIIMTDSNSLLSVEAMKKGAYSYLSKPINTQALRTLLEKFLGEDSLLAHKKILNNQDIKTIEKDSIDINKIVSKLGISENIAGLIINKFKKDIESDIKELKSLIEIQDIENISQKAHYIKNSCLNLSLDNLCKLLQELENKELQENEKKSIFEDINYLVKNLL